MKRKQNRKQAGKTKLLPVGWVALIGWIVLCEAVGIIGGLLTAPVIPTWYEAFAKPSFSPPDWLFAPVWTTLYALMAVAVYRVFRLGMNKPAVRSAVFLFLFQLTLNAIWSLIFFGGQNIPLGFVDIAALWITIMILVFRFCALDRVSAYLLMPYLGWVSFATVLNYNIWLLNP